MKILKKLIKKTIYMIKLFIYPLLRLYFKINPIKIKVLSLEDNLTLLKSGRKSFIRYGDGEIAVIKGNSLYFQEWSESLAKDLFKILNYEDENLIIGISDIFENQDKKRLYSRVFWNYHLFFNQKIYRSLEGRVWGNTFFSRPYMGYKDKSNKKEYFMSLKQLWENKDIVFIEGKTTRNGVGNDLYENAKSIKRILGPAANAYSYSSEIIQYIEENIPLDNLIILSLGPAAKIIGFELYKKGYQIIDAGHMDSEYEWCMMGATKAVTIKGKHTAEVKDMNMDDCTDDAYQSQIIKIF